MEDLWNHVNQIDLTIDVRDLFETEKGVIDFMIGTQIVMPRYINVEALLRVHRKRWTRNGSLDIKELDRTTFVFCFEDVAELVLILKKAP